MRLPDTDFDLTVTPALGDTLGVTVRNDRRGMVTWIDRRRFEAFPRYACRLTAAQLVEGSRLPIAVDALAEALEDECREALVGRATALRTR